MSTPKSKSCVVALPRERNNATNPVSSATPTATGAQQASLISLADKVLGRNTHRNRDATGAKTSATFNPKMNHESCAVATVEAGGNLPKFCHQDCHNLLLEDDGAWCVYRPPGEFNTGVRSMAVMTGCPEKKKIKSARQWVAIACACKFNNCTMLGERKPLACFWAGASEVTQ